MLQQTQRGFRYREGTKLAGIIYLHEITQARMRGSFLKNYDMFTKLCGDDAMANVIFATTKWDEIVFDAGIAREEELKTEFWQSVLDRGSYAARFMNTQASAWEIINLLVPKERLRALLIQQELVDLGRSLPETKAGIALREHLQAALRQHEKSLRQKLKAATAQRGSVKPSAEYEEADKRLREAEKQVETILDQIRALKIPIGRRIRRFFGIA
jgi:hypothetical protein